MGRNNSSTMVSNDVNGGGNEVIVEIDKMLDELEPPPSSGCCIYRVPMEVRKVNEEAYTPRIVSIGPFHHNNKRLESMEQVKKRYMRKLVRRNGNSSLTNCFDFVKNCEANIRNCYSERIDMDSKEFNIMVLVDSCFIIQFLIFYNNNWEHRDYDHSLYLEPTMITNLTLDLILLENQVPFSVLDRLFSLATSASPEPCSFLHLAIDFLNKAKNLHFFEEFEKYNSEHNLQVQSIKHFTDLVLILYRPPHQEPLPLQEGIFQSLRCSTKLTDAGVTFRAKEPSGFFDITFYNKVLEIPRFVLTDHTVIEIRNLLALDLCCCSENCLITDYFVFIDCLINTIRDVDLLVDKKIIINYLGDNKAAADFFKNLGTNSPHYERKFYFSEVCNKLNDHYKVPWHKLKAVLKRDYFTTPWKATSTIAAISLLVLTLIQTVSSIISTVRGK